ncbi:MAG: hypothetical protein AB4040_00155 [Synechococcus sp.]
MTAIIKRRERATIWDRFCNCDRQLKSLRTSLKEALCRALF